MKLRSFVRARRRRLGVLTLSVVLLMGMGGSALAGGIPVAPPSGLPFAPPFTPPSTTPVRPLRTLDSSHPVLHFGASLGSSATIVNNPDPLICAAGCFEYTVSIPAGSPPFLAAVKTTVTGPGGTFNADEGYDLYVYGPDQKLAAAANGIGSNGQSVAISAPKAGTYTVVVTYAYAYDSNSAFVGELRLMSGASWTPAAPTCGLTVSGVTGCFELPQLRVLPAYDLTTTGVPPVPSTPLGFPLPVSLPLPTSCYADETIGLDNLQITGLNNPALICLRFTSDIQNVGAGPLTAAIPAAATGPNGALQVGYIPGDCYASQLVEEAGGTTVERPAGACEFHVEHGHFHYNNLLSYALYQAGPGDTIGKQVVASEKESFCLSDDDYFGFGTPGPNGPRMSVGQPDCNLPRTASLPLAGHPGTGTFITEGVTPGWGDVYTWDTPDQYINVTHVPSGTYDLVEETNPAGQILVAGPAQTCSMTKIQLIAGTISDRVTALASYPSVPCP
jgi:hypothetical protein